MKILKRRRKKNGKGKESIKKQDSPPGLVYKKLGGKGRKLLQTSWSVIRPSSSREDRGGVLMMNNRLRQ